MESFDYIGAGSAGCVLANHLTTAGGTRVLLLEAGTGAAGPHAWGSPSLNAMIGLAFHSSQEDFQNDRERQNKIALLGWQVLRFTWLDLTEYPQRVNAEIAAAIRPPR